MLLDWRYFRAVLCNVRNSFDWCKLSIVLRMWKHKLKASQGSNKIYQTVFNFWRTPVLFVRLLILMFWTSGDVSYGSQRHLAEACVLHISGVTPAWHPAFQPRHSLPHVLFHIPASSHWCSSKLASIVPPLAHSCISLAVNFTKLETILTYVTESKSFLWMPSRLFYFWSWKRMEFDG